MESKELTSPETLPIKQATHLLYLLNECDFRDESLISTVELYLLNNLSECDLRALIEFTYVKKLMLQDVM